MVKRKLRGWEDDSDNDDEPVYLGSKKPTSASKAEVSTAGLRILVIIRGDITTRMYSIWEEKLNTSLRSLCITLCKDNFHSQINAVVASASGGKSSIESWMRSLHIPETALLVSSAWVVELLRTSSVPPFDPFRIVSSSLISSAISSSPTKSATMVPPHSTAFPTNPSDIPHSDAHASPLPPPRLPDPAPTVIPTTPSLSASKHSSNDAKVAYPMFAKHYARYACMKTGEIKQANPNKHITNILEALQNIYELTNDEWRAKGYKTCVGILKQSPKITRPEQLIGIRGIGSSIREKIEEILKTGSLKKLLYFQNDAKISSIVELSKIWGVGEKTAAKFLKQGFKGVADLRDRGVHLLTAQQQVGLKHYEDFLVKIPREEIEEIHKVVQNAVLELVPHVECIICGSYRRGKPTSGDADLILAPPEGIEALPTGTLDALIERLSDLGFLTDHLALPMADRGEGPRAIAATTAAIVTQRTASYAGEGSSKVSELSNQGALSQKSSASNYSSADLTLCRSSQLIRGHVRVFAGEKSKTNGALAAQQSPFAESLQVDLNSSITETLLDDYNINSQIASSQIETQLLFSDASKETGVDNEEWSLTGQHSPVPLAFSRSVTKTSSRKSGGPPGSWTVPQSRESYMGVCKLPGEGRLFRRIDIKVLSIRS